MFCDHCKDTDVPARTFHVYIRYANKQDFSPFVTVIYACPACVVQLEREIVKAVSAWKGELS